MINMTGKSITQKRALLINSANEEWQRLLDLRSLVQKDFNEKGYLAVSSFEKILTWKLADQPARIEKILQSCPADFLKNITRCYHEITHPDQEMEIRVKMHILITIPWIGMGIASSILALHKPQFFGALDFRSWGSLFQKEKKTFSINDYLRYLHSVRQLAVEVECDVQEIDYILWKEH